MYWRWARDGKTDCQCFPTVSFTFSLWYVCMYVRVKYLYSAPCLWNKLSTDLHEPRQIQSPSLSPITHGSLSSSSLSPLAYILLLVQSFILNLRLGFSANPFLHRPFPFLPDWFHGLSDHLLFLFCSTAGFVYMVC